MTNKFVLLSGCGNIGFRHLQALCAMTTPADITVVEPNTDLHPRIRSQFDAANAAAESPHTFELLTAAPIEPNRVDLSVVATTASARRAAVDEVLAHHEVSAAILEKVLFQTIADLDAVGDEFARRGIPAFVNCSRRTFPGYQQLRDALRAANAGPLDVTVTGNGFGLASNAVHFLDLAEYLSGAAITGVDADGLEPGSRPAKRPGNVEIFGTLRADLDDGSRLSITCADAEPIAVAVEIRAGDTTYRIDELARTVDDDTGGTGPRPFVAQNVSETSGIYDDVLSTGTCVLTPYADSARQHRHYLTALQSHLGLPAGADVVVPIS